MADDRGKGGGEGEREREEGQAHHCTCLQASTFPTTTMSDRMTVRTMKILNHLPLDVAVDPKGGWVSIFRL